MWPHNVDRSQLRLEFIRGSGNGGQKRNKTSSAVRITHLPTGLTGYAEDERMQSRNKILAFQRLAKKLVPLMVQREKRERSGSQKEVRVYHEPDNRVKDHRISDERWSYADVVGGSGLDKIIERLSEER